MSRPHSSRSQWILWSLSLLGLLSCAGEIDTPEPVHIPPRGLPQVRLYHYWDDAFARLRAELTRQGQRFQEADHGAHLVVTSVNHEAFKQNLPALASHAVEPECYSWWAGWRTRSLVEQELLQPLDTWWLDQDITRLFGQRLTDMACRYDGHYYLLPLVQSYVGVFYNRRLFMRLGLTPPQDWDELLALCRQLKTVGINPFALGTKARWPAQFWFDYLLLATAGPDYRSRLLAGEAALTDPEVCRVFDLWRELLAIEAFNPNHASLDWLDAAQLMHVDGAAMTLMGTWIIDPFAQWHWQPGDDFAFSPFPRIDPAVATSTLTVVDGLVLARNERSWAAIEEVLTFFASRETQAALAEAAGGFPPRRDLDIAQNQPYHAHIRTHITEHLSFALDLSTPPRIQELHLQLLIDFLADPTAIDQLLSTAEARRVAFYATRP